MEKNVLIVMSVCALFLASVSGYAINGKLETDLFENKYAEAWKEGAQIRREKRQSSDSDDEDSSDDCCAGRCC